MSIYNDLRQVREQVAYYMRRLYDKGLTTCSGGNISMKVETDLVLITPSGVDKGLLAAADIAMIGLDGTNMTPHLRPTIEAQMHLAIYKTRPDITAVAHTHSVFATALSCTDIAIEPGLTPEGVMAVGEIAKAAYYPAGTWEVADATATAMTKANVVVMANHGVTAVGKTLFQAFDRLEVTELSAKMTYITRTLGTCTPLDEAQKRRICDLMVK